MNRQTNIKRLNAIKKNPYPNIRFDILKLYKASKRSDEKILLHDISVFISKPHDFNEENDEDEEAFLNDVNYFIEEAEFFNLNKLVSLFKSLSDIKPPNTQEKITKEKVKAVLEKAEENWDLTNENALVTHELVNIARPELGNRKENRGPNWTWKSVTNSNPKSNGGRRRKTHKRHSKKRRHTRRR